MPGIVAHFDVSRERSIKAIEVAMMGEQKVFLVTQKDLEKEKPQIDDLYHGGSARSFRHWRSSRIICFQKCF